MTLQRHPRYRHGWSATVVIGNIIPAPNSSVTRYRSRTNRRHFFRPQRRAPGTSASNDPHAPARPDQSIETTSRVLCVRCSVPRQVVGVVVGVADVATAVPHHVRRGRAGRVGVAMHARATDLVRVECTLVRGWDEDYVVAAAAAAAIGVAKIAATTTTNIGGGSSAAKRKRWTTKRTSRRRHDDDDDAAMITMVMLAMLLEKTTRDSGRMGR